MKRDLKFEFTYPHPPERVWRALTNAESLASWLMPNDFAPRVGHTFQFRTDPAPGFDGVVNCRVLEVSEPRKLAYTWVGGGIDTIVTFTLAPESGGTRLILEHTGFEGVRGLMVSQILGSGWASKILRTGLPAVLDRLAQAETIGGSESH